MDKYSKWGAKPAGSTDRFMHGQQPSPPSKPNPVKIILETKEDTSRIDHKLDQLMETPEEDGIAQIIDLLEALVTRVHLLEQQQVRSEKATTVAFEALALSFRHVASGLRAFGIDVPLPSLPSNSQG